MFKKTFIFILLCFTVLRAQNYSRVDTLVYELEKLPMDTQRITLLNDLILEIHLNDPKIALKYAIEMTRLSRNDGYRFGIASGLNWQGTLYELMGELDSSQQSYFEAMPILLELDSLKDLATTYNNLAYNFMKTGNSQKALNFGYRSLDISVQLKDTTLIIENLLNIGGVYFRLDKLKKSLECYRTALHLAIDMEDNIQTAGVLRNIGRLFREQKDYEEAFYCFHKAYRFSSSVNNKEQMVKELNGMGTIFELTGNDRMAYQYFRKSLQVLDVQGFTRERGNTLNYLGHLYFKEGKLDSSKVYFDQALYNYRLIHDQEGVCQVTYYLAEYYLSMKDFISAEKSAYESYMLAEKLGYPLKIMNSARILSGIYKLNGKLLEYINTYERFVEVKDIVNNNKDREFIDEQKIRFDEYKSTLIIELAEKERVTKEKSQIFRRNILQYSLILLLVLLSFGLIFLMGYIKLPYRVAQALILVTLLSLFEFILALTDPLLDSITHGVPLYKVLVNLLLALSIFPIQTFMEKRLGKRLDRLKK